MMWTNAGRHSGGGIPAIGRAAMVLLYHRVTRLEGDPQLLAVAPERFEQQVAFLRQNAVPLSLAELVERLPRGDIPERAVVLTFDDGYEDNLEEAKPILAGHDVPATVFVTTSGLGGHREFWWDDLERMLLATPSGLSTDAMISAGGVDVRIPAGAYRPAAEHAGWTVLCAEAPTPRHAAYRTICETIRPLSANRRDAVTERIEMELRLPRVIRRTHRAMDENQLRRLADGGLIEIGAHTLTHPVLAALPLEEQQREIAESRRILEDVIGSPVRAFSYPFGGKGDYTSDTANCVRAAGYTHACANVPGLVAAGCDPWQLPRVLVRDWSVDEFATRLKSLWSHDEPAAARAAR